MNANLLIFFHIFFYQIGKKCFQLIAALVASQISLIAFVVFSNSGVAINKAMHA